MSDDKAQDVPFEQSMTPPTKDEIQKFIPP
jgi:hypothetical protein